MNTPNVRVQFEVRLWISEEQAERYRPIVEAGQFGIDHAMKLTEIAHDATLLHVEGGIS